MIHLKKGLADYHIHTTYSDGESTIEDYAQAADRLGFKEIAIADHVCRTSDWLDDYVREIDELNLKYSVNILKGCEAELIDMKTGGVDWADQADLDFVMGVVHNHLFDDGVQPALKEAFMSLKLIRNGDVLVLGHPARNYHKFHQIGNTRFPKEYLCKIVEQAAFYNTMLDCNWKLPGYALDLLEAYAGRFGATLIFGSDSHSVDEFEQAAEWMYLWNA